MSRSNESTTPVQWRTLDVAPPRASATPWVVMLMMVALAASGGYWFFQEHQMVREALAGAETEIARAKRHAARADSRVMSVEAELSKVRGDFSMNKQQQRRTREELSAQLGDVVAEGPAALAEAGDALHVRLDASSVFLGGRLALSQDGRILLQNVAAVLARFPDVEIWVRAVSRQDGDAWQRSTAQSLAVARYLAQESVEPDRLALLTHAAEAEPATPGWRVELVLDAAPARM